MRRLLSAFLIVALCALPSSARLRVNNLIGFGVAPSGVNQVSIDIVTEGTWSGSMSANGGIAAAHDGTTNQSQAASARSSGANGALADIIIDWGAGNDRIVSQLELYAPNNSTMFDGGTGTISLIGSTDNFSTSNVTLYTASGISEPGIGGTVLIERASITTTTAYRYHKVEYTATGGKPVVAEQQMWEDL